MKICLFWQDFQGHGSHAHNSVLCSARKYDNVTVLDTVPGLKIAMMTQDTSLSPGDNSGQATNKLKEAARLLSGCIQNRMLRYEMTIARNYDKDLEK